MKNILQSLDQSKYPKKYGNYFEEEEELVHKVSRGDVLDVGCGKGRIVSRLNKVCTSYTGIDMDKEVLNYAKLKNQIQKIPQHYVHGDCNSLNTFFKKNQFDMILCLWNTLSIIGDGDEMFILRQMGELIKNEGKILITLAAKNDLAFKTRLDYYSTNGSDFHFNDKTQTFFSNLWGKSKAYNLEDIMALGEKSELKIDKIGNIGYLGIYGLFSRKKK